MTQPVPFSGLAPDRRIVRARKELLAFDVEDALAIGNTLRLLAKEAPSKEAIAGVIADHLHAFDVDGRAACSMVQVLVARPLSSLAPDLAAAVYAGGAVAPSSNPLCLVLLAVRAVEPAVSAAASSERVRLLGSSQDPLISEVVEQLGLGSSSLEQARSIFLEDASQLGPFGVERVIGFGIEVATSETVIALAFCRAPVERKTARLLEVVAPYVKIAWSGDVHEELTKKQRRLQAAMLNVIEDLREARTSLEKLVEERTRALENRNKELEEFVYITSHDLQEPLRTVSGYLQIIERRYGKKLGVEADEFIQFSIDGAKRMQSLLDALLHYSRVTRDDQPLEPVSLDAALDSALRNLAIRVEETNAVITRTPLPAVQGSPVQMVQLFQNLVGNAIKFAGPRAPKITIDGKREGPDVTIRVRDEGLGFPPKFADRIFKVFRRLRRDVPGTGIGLAICKKIVDRHGGRIEVESEPDVGSTFTVRGLRASTETQS